MKTNQIFIGDIRKCTKYDRHTTFSCSTYFDNQCIGCDSIGYIDKDDELYKANAILIKIQNGGYVDLEKLHSILDYIGVYLDITKDGYRLGGLMMSTFPYCINSLFVDESSLRPYYDSKQQTTDISVRQLKKQVKNNR